MTNNFSFFQANPKPIYICNDTITDAKLMEIIRKHFTSKDEIIPLNK